MRSRFGVLAPQYKQKHPPEQGWGVKSVFRFGLLPAKYKHILSFRASQPSRQQAQLPPESPEKACPLLKKCVPFWCTGHAVQTEATD